MTRVYSDHELREMLARYVRGSALDAEVASVLVPTVRLVLEQRDEARARCVELLGPRKSGHPSRLLPEELLTAVAELQGAAAEPCAPVDNRLIDAMLALIAYVQRIPPPPPPQEPDGESILLDPKAIAERHGVDVPALLDRMDSASALGLRISRPEMLFLMDLLAVLGLE